MGYRYSTQYTGAEYREDQEAVDLTLGELRASEYKKPYGTMQDNNTNLKAAHT